MRIITLQEAREQNLKHYFTGNPCAHGHVDRRYVVSRHCVECQRVRTLEYGRTDRAKKRCKDKRLLTLYGVTQEYLDSVIACEVCKSPLDASGTGRRGKCIDHCHVSGEVRGVLCNNCNRALGLFQDSIDSLQNAIIYLTEGRSDKVIPTEWINE